jgi:hypothetical protein
MDDDAAAVVGFSASPETLWTTGALLLGIQSAATAWRAGQEREAGGPGELLWLPPCEILNLLSVCYSVVGVYVLPTVLRSRGAMELAFCVYLLTYAAYPLAVLGHHEGFLGHAHERSLAYCTRQERNCVLMLVIAVVLYLGATLAVHGVDAPKLGVALFTVPVFVLLGVYVCTKPPHVH